MENEKKLNKEEQAAWRMRAHLIGEAFPGKFTIVFAFPRNPEGCVEDVSEVECMSNVVRDCEKRILESVLRKLSIS